MSEGPFRVWLSDTEAAQVREILLRMACKQAPVRAGVLWGMAAREARILTPHVIAEMWDLVDDGLLEYDGAAMISVVDQRARFAHSVHPHSSVTRCCGVRLLDLPAGEQARVEGNHEAGRGCRG
jgi:hypothetical protein